MSKMSSTITKSSKFKSLSEYNQEPNLTYELLPFRFIKLDDTRYVLTNEVGEFLLLDRETLVDFVHRKLEPNSSIYNDLKSRHMLIDSDSNVALDLLALKYRTKMQFVENFTSLHLFITTLRCDHSCPYCQVSRQSEDRLAFDMTTEIADKGIEFTFRSPSPSIKIEFQGGESLLNFDLIKYIVSKAKEKNEIAQKELGFVIATNLSQVTDEILEYCHEHSILISTSLDGPEDLHNKNRPRPGNDSYQKTIEGINKVKEFLGPDQVSALMTTTLASLSRPKEIIDEYIRQGFRSIFLRSLSPYGFAIKTKSYDLYDTDTWLDFYKEGLDYIIQLNKDGFFFVEEYTSLILNRMLTPLGTGYVDLQSPAGVGISVIVFNYDGDIYASDESRMLAEMGETKFKLGNLLNNTYEEIMLSDTLLDTLESSIAESVPMCNDCGFQPYCGSEPVYHYATQKDIIGNKMLSGFCKKNMTIFKHLITLLSDDKEAREILMRWIRV